MDKLEAIKNKLREMGKQCKVYKYACWKCPYTYECVKAIGVSTPSKILEAIENIEKLLND